MSNLDPCMNQQNIRNEEEEISTANKFGNHLLYIRDERQEMIRPNCHPTYNERHQKIIEMIDWTLANYKANIKKTQQNDEQIIIDNIIEELNKKKI